MSRTSSAATRFSIWGRAPFTKTMTAIAKACCARRACVICQPQKCCSGLCAVMKARLRYRCAFRAPLWIFLSSTPLKSQKACALSRLRAAWNLSPKLRRIRWPFCIHARNLTGRSRRKVRASKNCLAKSLPPSCIRNACSTMTLPPPCNSLVLKPRWPRVRIRCLAGAAPTGCTARFPAPR